ncbi:MAG: lipoyl(octanoyl) transferase LipB [Thiotrichales bacterium]|nr:lipoyl(octanoyl) transferase LipB [Thiotrichales bacterium]
MKLPPLLVKQLGIQPYTDVWQAMRQFSSERGAGQTDELWIVQHPPVYTQGLNGKPEHLLNPNPAIPIVQTDRGGQITYHGPGQLIVYLLIDLKARHLGVRALVSLMEKSLIELLKAYEIEGVTRANAPGVYVNDQKIASLGLKIHKQKTYHGLALNVDMDLTPFHAINPCGYAGLQMTQLANLYPNPLPNIEQLGEVFSVLFQQHLDALRVTNC